MSYAIPKIEYKNYATAGTTTNLNGVLTSIGDTTDIEVGMFVIGTAIPVGATVGSKTASTVTLASSVLATATASGVALTFGFKVEFDYPPIETKGAKIVTNSSINESISGIRQVSVNNKEEIRALIFSFISPSLKVLMDTFLQTHALNGETFRYFENKTLTPYTDYELDDLKAEPAKIASKGVDLYTWKIPLKFRRVL